MLPCWNQDPDRRPTFSQICVRLPAVIKLLEQSETTQVRVVENRCQEENDFHSDGRRISTDAPIARSLLGINQCIRLAAAGRRHGDDECTRLGD